MIRKILPFVLLVFFGCNEEQTPEEKNHIPSNGIEIGNQIWMKKNLELTTFRNGDEIFHAKDQKDWNFAYLTKIPAWSYYEDLEENGKVYGKLYNYFAVIDNRKLAPEGWRIPEIEDWNQLFEFNGGIHNAGIKLKSTSYWLKFPGTNESGFGALPGGERYLGGYFNDLGSVATFWTLSFDENAQIILTGISDENSRIYETSISPNDFDSYKIGLSLRCIKE